MDRYKEEIKEKMIIIIIKKINIQGSTLGDLLSFVCHLRIRMTDILNITQVIILERSSMQKTNGKMERRALT